jgi:DNA-binding NtrC family response regulator
MRVLFVDDDPALRQSVEKFFALKKIQLEEAGSCEEAEKRFRAATPDVCVVDYALPDGTAIDLIKRFKGIDADIPIIVLTGNASIDLAVRAIKEGAEQFLTKPVELPALALLVERASSNVRHRSAHHAHTALAHRSELDPFCGTSAAINEMRQTATKYAKAEASILLLGETGAGKSVLARWLHEHGPRAEGPFVELNCAGLSREFLESELFGHERGAFTGAIAAKQGLFEIANRGTLFLDEIGELELELQPKLLTALEEKRYRRMGDVKDRSSDVRLIAATHRDIPALVKERAFREDLYFRINTLVLTVTPLRLRSEDVVPLAEALLATLAIAQGRMGLELGEDAKHKLNAHAWPGNVRELRNTLERACVLSEGEQIGAADIRLESDTSANV